jgi:hypothetical protein
MQGVLRTGHADLEEPAFLFEIVALADRQIGRNTSVVSDHLIFKAEPAIKPLVSARDEWSSLKRS